MPRRVALTVLVVALSGAALAAGASKDEAVAMVKKAVAAIKAEGADKAYAEISNPQGLFVDRDLYIVVYRIDGVVLAHGADKKLVGVDRLHDKDVDGKEFVKERVQD
jgi:cytochrome c